MAALPALGLTASPHIVFATADETASAKPRVVVLTDISNEPDDEESLVRLLTAFPFPTPTDWFYAQWRWNCRD